jgi:hypothetical protein
MILSRASIIGRRLPRDARRLAKVVISLLLVAL